MNDKLREKIRNGESVFTGSMFGLLGIDLATVFLAAITFGIAYPWLRCWRESWYAEHTYINGRRLYFDGTGGQWFGKWLLWMILTVITFGIYALWIPIKIEQWRISHTHFEDEYSMPSVLPADRNVSVEAVEELSEPTEHTVYERYTPVSKMVRDDSANRAENAYSSIPGLDDSTPPFDRYGEKARYPKENTGSIPAASSGSGFSRPDEFDLD